jgi:hypothetical protein
MINEVRALSAKTLLSQMGALKIKADLIYADVMYGDKEQKWIESALDVIRPCGYIVIQTDYRSVAEIKIKLDRLFAFLNWVVYPYDWGGRPKKAFGRKHDDILIYYKYEYGCERTFNAKKVAIQKKVMIRSDKGLEDPNGRVDGYR